MSDKHPTAPVSIIGANIEKEIEAQLRARGLPVEQPDLKQDIYCRIIASGGIWPGKERKFVRAQIKQWVRNQNSEDRILKFVEDVERLEELQPIDTREEFGKILGYGE